MRRKRNAYTTIIKQALGVERDTVQKWAADKMVPSLNNALRLEELFGLPLTSFLTERPKTWNYIKSLDSHVLKNKLMFFLYKQNLNQ